MGIQEVELDETQALMIMTGILRCKENEYFRDALADEYQSLYAENLALRCVTGETKQKLLPHFYNLKISDNKLNYLMRLTGVNPFDEREVSDFLKYQEELNKSINLGV